MDEHSLPVPRAIGARVVYGVVTVVLPASCFLLGDLLKPEWQSGLPSAYASILLGPWATVFFAPLLAYAVICLLLLLAAPRRFAPFFGVRLGIYGGFFLALQYAVLLGITISGSKPLPLILGGLFLCAAPLGIRWVYRIAQQKFGRRTVGLVLLVLGILVAVLIAVTSLFTYGAPLIPIAMLILAGAPFWCLEIAAFVSFRLLRDYEFKARLTAWHVVGPLAWLGAWGVAWRFAVLKMWEVYAPLPPQPPQCYVATAAAKGHPRFVRSWPAATQDNRPFRVNRQLQRLKCAELALQAAWPAGHRRLRQAYDNIGPRLACRLHHPLLADAAYLLLKPVEWGTWAALRTLIPEINALASRVYGQEIALPRQHPSAYPIHKEVS
jgi:hypothetical protein